VIDNRPTPKLYEEALREAALRLAWYVETHGPIPDKEILKLAIAARGIQHTAQTDRLLALARDIEDYLLEIAG
jgi:hypothetical protein